MDKKFARIIYDTFNEHFILGSLIGGFPAIWFLIIEVGNKPLNLSDTNGEYKPLIYFFSALFLAVSFLFILLKAISDKYNITVLENGNKVMTTLLASINKFKRYKCDTLVNNYELIKPECNKYCTKLNPIDNINELLAIFPEYLAIMFGLIDTQVGISVLYNYKNKKELNDWHLVGTRNIKHDLSKKELITNTSTTASRVINGEADFIFHADKLQAAAHGLYVPGKKDKGKKAIGSIVCCDISVDMVTAVLSITTYDKQIGDEGNIDVENKLKELIINTIANRVIIEVLIQAMNENKKCHTDLAKAS